jgi:hypothetical protein
MLNPTLTLKSTAGVDHDFVLISQTAQGSVRIEDTSTKQAPLYLNILHSESASKKGVVTDRHLVQVQWTLLHSETGIPGLVTCNITLALDRSVEFPTLKGNDALSYAGCAMFGPSFDPADFSTTNLVAQILRGES